MSRPNPHQRGASCYAIIALLMCLGTPTAAADEVQLQVGLNAIAVPGAPNGYTAAQLATVLDAHFVARVVPGPAPFHKGQFDLFIPGPLMGPGFSITPHAGYLVSLPKAIRFNAVTLVPVFNGTPSANAGPDRQVVLPTTVTLTASASDPDGDVVTYSWTRHPTSPGTGPTVTLVGLATSAPSFTPTVPGTYAFRLSVFDSRGAFATDDVTITVAPALQRLFGRDFPLLADSTFTYRETLGGVTGDISWRTFSPSTVNGVITTPLGSGADDLAKLTADAQGLRLHEDEDSTYTPPVVLYADSAESGSTTTGSTFDSDEAAIYHYSSRLQFIGSTTVPAGTFSSAWQVRFHSARADLSDPNDVTVTIVPGIGVAVLDDPPRRLELVGARVGGVLTGSEPIPPDVVAPNLLSSEPANGASVSGPVSQIKLRFDEAMYRYGHHFSLSGSTSITNVGFDASSRVFTITLASSLGPGNYSLTLNPTIPAGSSSFRDRSGNRLAANTQVSFTVQDTTNRLPTANAGIDRSVTLPTSVALSGSGSDPDGDTLSYSWARHPTSPGNGPTVTLSGAVTASASFTPTVAGTYTFQLTVSDSKGASAIDDVIITVAGNSGGSGLTFLSANAKGFNEYRNEKDGSILIEIPTGTFTMGSPNGTGDSDEHTQHQVTLSKYYIGKYEVTNAQYRAFLAATSDPKGPTQHQGHFPGEPTNHTPRGPTDGGSDVDWPPYSVGDNDPIVGVSWYDAYAYCAWAELRMPTEAQWERAARGNDARSYPWGNDAPDVAGLHRANYYTGSLNNPSDGGADGFKYAAPIGAFGAEAPTPRASGTSPIGALDMAGNVWEWCFDWYYSLYYNTTTTWNDPVGPIGLLPGSESPIYRTLRGASFHEIIGSLRAADRNKHDPLSRFYDVGFRVGFQPSQ